MRMSNLNTIIAAALEANPNQAVYVSGAPGVGKTSMAYDIADKLGIPRDRILLFRPSLRDPVDLMGVPSVDREQGLTRWNPPAELHNFREGTGPGMILWDELPQAVTQMQNAAAGCLLDWVVGDLKIDKQVVQLATGNRTKDKAGANKVVSQLGNRVMHLELEAHLDDWCSWAFGADIDPLLIGFIRLRPDLLHDFNPDRLSNPTPRSWEMVSRSVPTNLPRDLFFAGVSGLVGEGAAVEYAGFRDTAAQMPSIDNIMLNPTTAEVPEKMDVLYAVCAALAHRTTGENFDRIMQYIDRLPTEFSTMVVKDALIRTPAVAASKAFTSWAVKNADVFI